MSARALLSLFFLHSCSLSCSFGSFQSRGSLHRRYRVGLAFETKLKLLQNEEEGSFALYPPSLPRVDRFPCSLSYEKLTGVIDGQNSRIREAAGGAVGDDDKMVEMGSPPPRGDEDVFYLATTPLDLDPDSNDMLQELRSQLDKGDASKALPLATCCSVTAPLLDGANLPKACLISSFRSALPRLPTSNAFDSPYLASFDVLIIGVVRAILSCYAGDCGSEDKVRLPPVRLQCPLYLEPMMKAYQVSEVSNGLSSGDLATHEIRSVEALRRIAGSGEGDHVGILDRAYIDTKIGFENGSDFDPFSGVKGLM